MDNWKDSVKVGNIVCLNNYGGIHGVRFGTIEEVDRDDFLVKMKLNEDENPIHYKSGYYRRYKYHKIKADGIVIV